MENGSTGPATPEGIRVVTRYITRNGKKIFPKNAKVFVFYVSPDKERKK